MDVDVEASSEGVEVKLELEEVDVKLEEKVKLEENVKLGENVNLEENVKLEEFEVGLKEEGETGSVVVDVADTVPASGGVGGELVVLDRPGEKQEYVSELQYWMCVCLNLEDWTAIYNKYSGRKSGVDVFEMIGES